MSEDVEKVAEIAPVEPLQSPIPVSGVGSEPQRDKHGRDLVHKREYDKEWHSRHDFQPDVKLRKKEYAHEYNLRIMADPIRKERRDSFMKEHRQEYNRKWLEKPENKQKSKDWQKEYRQRPDVKEKRREYNRVDALMRKYGITLVQFNDILKKQEFICPICSTKLNMERRKEIHVDHCHTKNIVRGVLCQRCNILLGHAKDSREILFNAAKYLENVQ